MRISVVCVPYQLDVARWGYALGPQTFLEAGILRQLRALGHDVSEPLWIELPREERTRDTVTNLGRIAARTSAAVREGLRDGGFVLVLEGDCTHAVGPIGGLERVYGPAGVVWFDAHGDLHTMATTTSGYLGGMPYAVALGWDLDDWRLTAGLKTPIRPEAAALLGTSDLDVAEVVALSQHPLLHIPADDMGDPGTGRRIASALRDRAEEAVSWYLHIDVDVAGPVEVPGGMTPTPHWPPRKCLIESVAAAAATVETRVLGLATYNPAGDPLRRGARFGLDVALAAIRAIACQ
jgi:arginase